MLARSLLLILSNETRKRSLMNAMSIKGDWNVLKGRVKQKLAELMNNDSMFVEGEEDEIIGRIQQKAGCARDDFNSLMDKNSDC